MSTSPLISIKARTGIQFSHALWLHRMGFIGTLKSIAGITDEDLLSLSNIRQILDKPTINHYYKHLTNGPD